jgi:hypothetical protein
MWDMVEQYDGTDNAQACVDISNEAINGMQLQDKVAAYFFDAADLGQWKKKYDMVITTWFTAGNFYPEDFSFETYKDAGEKLNLDKNKKFEKIFSGAYNLLNEGGEIVIGSCYKHNDRTRLKQEESYKKMGMSIITNPEDTFTATKEGFWSQRFTTNKLLSYLHFVPAEKITIVSLDTYDYAMQVRIKK